VRPISGAQFGRAAFRFVKAVAKAERPTYNVLLAEQPTCDCPHGTYKADVKGPCRHVLAAQALLSRGKLPEPTKPAPRQVHVRAALDGRRVRVPATLDAAAPSDAGDDGYQTCDECGRPAAGCRCELALAPGLPLLAVEGGAA
jgi:hypothetical protein